MNDNYENEPVPAMTARKPARKLDLRMLYAGAAVTAAVVILLLCMTVFFNVSNVEIRGVSLYTDDQIINVGGIYEDMNLVRTDPARAEKRLTDNLVYIDEVKISKSYPSTVVIDCKEAVKAADIEYEGGYYVLSYSGRILEADNPEPTGDIPIVTGFKFYVAEDQIEKGAELTEEEIFAYRAPGAKLRSEDDYSDKILIDLLNGLKDQGFEKVKNIDMTSRANILMNVDNRLDIKLGSSADIEYKLSYFKAVMGKLAENYEGTLIYNGSENGVSAIPKDQYLGKPTFAKDPEKPKDESKAEDETADNTDNTENADNTAEDQNTEVNGDNADDNTENIQEGEQYYDNGDWTDNTWDDGQYYDYGDQNYDNGGWYDDTNGGGEYYW